VLNTYPNTSQYESRHSRTRAKYIPSNGNTDSSMKGQEQVFHCLALCVMWPRLVCTRIEFRDEGRAWEQSLSSLVCYLTSLSEFIRPLHPIEYSSITIRILSDECLVLVQRRRRSHRALSMDRCIWINDGERNFVLTTSSLTPPLMLIFINIKQISSEYNLFIDPRYLYRHRISQMCY
jgi:hypothetical protein